MKIEYIDVKNVKHKVEHLTLWANDKESREHIIAELLSALSKPVK